MGLECCISCLLLRREGSLGPSLKLAIANGNETVFRVLDFILTTMRTWKDIRQGPTTGLEI